MRNRVPLLLSLAALLLLAGIAARGQSAVPLDGRRSPFDLFPDLPNAPNVPYTPVRARFDPPEHTDTLAPVLLLVALPLTLLVVVVVMAVARVVRRRNPDPAVSGDALPDTPLRDSAATGEQVSPLLAAAREAKELLDAQTHAQPTDAVIAAWLTLERAAAKTGTTRHPWQTPTEFTSAVLGGHDVDVEAVDGLRELYQRARFSRSGAVTRADADAARGALARIVSSLDRRVRA